jgi:hypothetical protein
MLHSCHYCLMYDVALFKFLNWNRRCTLGMIEIETSKQREKNVHACGPAQNPSASYEFEVFNFRHLLIHASRCVFKIERCCDVERS